MSKILDVFQWGLFLLSIAAMLFVSWKIGLFILATSFVIGLARKKWSNHE